MSVPEDIVQQFRGLALQRLQRVEAAWATVLTSVDDASTNVIHHEIHTLKGESRMVGFTDVNMVCHKLEDLLEVARARGYAVDEDVDLAVNMALRFMAMLVRKKVGAQLHGIDLPGFVRQIDALLADASRDARAVRQTGPIAALRRDPSTPRVSAALRDRLAPIAVDAFVEYAAARGPRRDRLRTSWHALRELVGVQRAVLGYGQLSKHRANAIELAHDLDKELDTNFEIGTAEITAETLGAIDSAVLHLVRNAVDHGLESPAARAAASKPRTGMLRLTCRARADRLVVTVEDDGRGIDLDAVVARAIELGLVARNGAAEARERWLDIVCHPGFTTRTEASEVSGRGVGLDVVRATIADVGGVLSARTAAGAGSTWTIDVPLPKLTIGGHVFRVAGAPFPIVVEDHWKLVDDVTAATAAKATIIDVALRLGLVDEPSPGTPRYLSDGWTTIGIISDRLPAQAQVRRTVVAGSPSIAEVVTLDTVEGLLLRPERL